MSTEPQEEANAEIQRLRHEGLLVSQPELARQLGVQSATVRRWCQMLGLEPASSAGSQLPIS